MKEKSLKYQTKDEKEVYLKIYWHKQVKRTHLLASGTHATRKQQTL
jgi:hypothetical protein